MDLALELIAVTEKYDLTELKDKCENYCISHLTNDNAWKAMQEAKLHRAKNLLKEAALKFSTCNKDEMLVK